MQIFKRQVILTIATLLTCAGLMSAATSPAYAAPELTDQAISDTVDDELLYDPGVAASKVDVTTTDGIVTLKGNVTNILAKDRAARIAETVKGVRSVVNRIDVDPAFSRSDDQIRRDVETALLTDPGTESFQIDTSVEDGEVSLSGSVDSFQERQLAVTVAKGVRGVTAIENQIDVNYDADRSDGEIQLEVAQALKWDTRVDDNLIEVEVNDSVVSLSGIVGSAAEKRQAQQIAWVAGVSAVEASELSVEKWARDENLRGDKYVFKSEEKLVDAVKDALLYDPRVSSFDIEVDASGSMITLRGEVDNLKAKRAAKQDAKNTVGVSYVDNRLKVRLDVWPEDSEIAANIRDALLRDPNVERYEVTVSVIDGTAHLYGDVDSYFDKLEADDIASNVTGVIEVENHLDVDRETTYIYDPYVDEYLTDDEWIDYSERSPLMTDSQIESSIENELWWSPFVDSDEVTVEVEDSKATLTGTVETMAESRAATENAYEGGATLVDNDLVVNYNY